MFFRAVIILHGNVTAGKEEVGYFRYSPFKHFIYPVKNNIGYFIIFSKSKRVILFITEL